MFKEGDRIVPLSLKLIRLSCVRNTHLRAGNGVSVRAKEVVDGYELSLRVDGKYQTRKLRIKRRILPGKRRGGTAAYLCCDCCGAPAHKFLYLDWDTYSARCSKCLGIPAGRMKRYGIYVSKAGYSVWDADDAAKFKRIMRKKLIADIAAFEFEALKALTPEDFFTSRPYLVPEIVALLKYHEPDMYRKSLRALSQKYRAVVQHYRIPTISKPEEKWLDIALRDRVANEHFMNTEEQRWLVKHWERAPRPSKVGLKSGTKLDLSALQPLATGSSSWKISSVVDTSVEHAKEPVSSPALNAVEQEATSEEITSSSAPPVKVPE